jgi:carboxypeptidase Q
MCRPPGVAALLVAISVPLASVPRAAGSADLGRELARSSIDEGKSVEYARELTAMGPRLTGSAAYQRAADWCAAQLGRIGFTQIALEPFTIERGWERVFARAHLIAPADRPLHVESLGWTPSTPQGGVEAEVVALETYSTAAIATRHSLRGRIVLLPDGDPPAAADTDSATLMLGAALRAAGVVAALAPDSEEDNGLTARGFSTGTTIAALPVAQVGRQDAQEIRRLLLSGPVRLSLELTNRITAGPTIVNSVVAEMPGRDAGEWVLVGAHLDSWDFASGAQDNATGVAMVLEAARAIAALKLKPRRSIRFALWGGEEQGQLGSTTYAHAHAVELEHLIAMLNADAGTGRTIGWTAPGRSDVVRGVSRLAQGALDDLRAGVFDESLRYAFQSDGAPFVLAGIPVLDLNSDDTRYEDIHHTAADTFDRVEARNLAIGAAAVATTAYAIADAAVPVAPRLDRRSIERLRRRKE